MIQIQTKAMMFSSTQSPHNFVQPLHQKRPAGLASIDLEAVLTKSHQIQGESVDGETRQQILQSLVMRMRRVGYLRRLSVHKVCPQARY